MGDARYGGSVRVFVMLMMVVGCSAPPPAAVTAPPVIEPGPDPQPGTAAEPGPKPICTPAEGDLRLRVVNELRGTDFTLSRLIVVVDGKVVQNVSDLELGESRCHSGALDNADTHRVQVLANLRRPDCQVEIRAAGDFSPAALIQLDVVHNERDPTVSLGSVSAEAPGIRMEPPDCTAR